MSPDLWQRVEEIFTAAMKTSGTDRAAFLERACGSDQELRREVESLLSSAEKAGDFLARPVLAPPPGHQRELGEGSRIGPYRILRRLGSGGMGVVYLASRADREYEQQVAVKILKEETGSREIVRRFRHERQILAELEHPHIARLMDGGTTGDRRPYFVMEYVEGEPIDRFCDRRRLTIRQRLELYRKVCSAVHFFHQNLVLHRDLKPGNILVKADGEPRLLDFGIAKLMGAGTRALTTLTAGPAPLTMDYASPEQVRGEALTVASDVYALGVLLYKLLSGHHPNETARSLKDKLDLICTREPEPPSRAVRRTAEITRSDGTVVTLSPESVSATREGEPATLERRLAGDLDRIVLKALAKEPQHRYASADQLGEDLDRYLEGRPVRAHPPTVAYRTWKFVRRHAPAVVAAAAMLLVLVGFSVNMKLLRDQAVGERHRAERERDRAERERDRAERLSDFLIDLFQSPNPRHSRGRDLTVRQLLDEKASSIRGDDEIPPEDKAAFLGAMGGAYLGLGDYEEAETLLEESLELRRTSDATPEALATSLLNLGHCRQLRGRHAEAEELFRKALAVLHRASESDSGLFAQAINSLAGALEDQGRPDAAEERYREALEIRLRIFGDEHEEVANSRHNLAACLEKQGRYEEAEPLCRRARNQRLKFHGPVSLEVAKTSNVCARVLQGKGDLPNAERFFRESLAIRREIYEPQHQDVVTGLNNLAVVLFLQEQYSEAAQLYDEALAKLHSQPAAPKKLLGVVLRNQAELLLVRGDPGAAERTVGQALEFLRAACGAGHWRVADAESVLGACRMELGHLEQARSLLERSYRVLREAKGPEAQKTREARARLDRLQRRVEP